MVVDNNAGWAVCGEAQAKFPYPYSFETLRCQMVKFNVTKTSDPQGT